MTSRPDEPRPDLPASIGLERAGSVLRVSLRRPAKRNALDDATVLGLDRLFSALQPDIRAVVLTGEGEHFCSGLDLSELKERDAAAGLRHSMMWHRAFEKIQFGPVPVVAVLKGAVIGGGLELACAAHIRVAEHNAFYALPEGQRGIFVGGGASVRLPRLIGASRMMEMMLTGRAYGAEEGVAIGFSHYLTEAGQGEAKAQELAEKVSGNAPMTNLALLQVFPRIVEADPATGFVTEALMAAIAQSDEEAKSRMRDFLERRSGRVERPA